MEFLWYSLFIGALQRQMKDFNLTEIICLSELSGPLYGEVIPLILTLITVCSPVNTIRLMAEEGWETQGRSPMKSKNRPRGRHVHVCHLTSHECDHYSLIKYVGGGYDRLRAHWYTAWQIYIYVFLVNNIRRKTEANNPADFNAWGLGLFSSVEGWRISKHCRWKGLLRSCWQ